MEGQSISQKLAQFVHRLSYDALPKDVVEAAKTRILDSLSTSLAGYNLPSGQIALAVVKDSKGPATVIGQRRGYAVRDAAFVNGVTASNTAQSDSQLEGGHPSTTIVPAALAMAEQEGSSGRDVIAAIVLGYELMNRMTLGTPADAGRDGLLGGFRNSTVFGIFGVAAAAGRLMKLGEEQLTQAIGYAADLASGLTEGFGDGTPESYFQAGLTGQNGIMAAAVARAGAVASETILEGKHGFFLSYAGTTEKTGRITAELGKSYAILKVRRKPYPACGGNQLSLNLGQRLYARYALNPRDIIRVVEIASPKKKAYAGIDAHPPYTNDHQATMSAQFCLASALFGKPVESHKFFEESYDDADIAELAAKIELVGELREGRGPRIEVYLKDGRQYSIEEDVSDILIPTWENTEAKFRGSAAEALRQERIPELVGLIKNMDSLEDIRQLTHKLRF